jgi:hypothetical protein
METMNEISRSSLQASEPLYKYGIYPVTLSKSL